MKVTNNEAPNQKKWTCAYTSDSTTKEYPDNKIYPKGMCPFLYHSTYPYMLGLLYGADFRQGENGEAMVSCPAKNGCKTIIKKRPIKEIPELEGDPRINPKHDFVIYTEVRSVGECPEGYEKGKRFFFPTCMEKDYVCPAAWYQSFPLSNPRKPSCINLEEIKCPDSEQDVLISILDQAK